MVSLDSAATGSLWVSCPQPNPQARLRLFCLPYAGASVALFGSWARLLPPEIELWLVHLPGRDRRLKEAPCTRLALLAETLAEAMRPCLDNPFAFFGHSMGAVIGFELVRHLRRQWALEPVHLFVSGRRAPQLPDSDPPFHHLPDAAFLAELQRRYNGVPEVILREPELLKLFLPILRADVTLMETYHYREEAPLDCPISAFCGQQDNTANQQELAAWRVQTQGTFRLEIFPGGHFFVQEAPTHLVQAVVKDLTRYLGQPIEDESP